MRRSIAAALAAPVLAGQLACGGGVEPPAASVPPALPLVNGTLRVRGLSAPVQVVRDRWGIPHIAAATEADLFFAQGFVQAQDRLFQMDLWRRSVQGRLAEVLGPNFVERDAMTRRIRYRGPLEQEWTAYGGNARSIAAAFTRGINAWVDEARADLPEEFKVAGWAPEYWSPEDLLNRTDAFVASGDAQDEVFRSQLVAAIGREHAGLLLPPSRMAPGASIGDPPSIAPLVGDLLRRVGTAPFFMGLAAPPAAAGRGSNAWAIAGRLTETGAPIVAADPHLPLTAPSSRYLVHLRAPGWHLAGATAPWLPGVAIGHNDRVAWAMAAAPGDTQEIVVVRTHPERPHQVLDAARWVEMTVEPESIAIKGGGRFDYERQYTRQGVVIGHDRDRHIAYVLRWTGTAPGGASELGALALGGARSAGEFAQALAHWRMPVADFVFADVDGHIGQRRAGLLLESGPSGRVDRSTPDAAAVFAANERRSRERRLEEAFAATSSWSVAAAAALQRDVRASNADALLPLLARTRDDRPEVAAARARLLDWDRQVVRHSSAAALYIAWESTVIRRLTAEQVPPFLRTGLAERVSNELVSILTSPTPAWFGARPSASRDALMVAALAEVVETRDAPFLRPVLFSHPLAVGDAGRRRFNVGEFEIGGYRDTILAIEGRGGEGTVGPAVRFVFDVADWDRTLAINAPGQSGWAASPHYGDLAALWAGGDYTPLAFTDAAVAAHAVDRLTLDPAN
jgi:penicillin amidase